MLALALSGCDPVSWLRPPPEATSPSAPAGPRTPEGCADAPTWESFAQGWLRTWCTPCHGSALPAGARQGAPVGVDFDTYAATLLHADRLVPRAGDPASTMPPAGGPSLDERAALTEWVRCGLPGAATSRLACDAPVRVAGGTVDDAAAFCAAGDLHVEGDLIVDDVVLPCLCGVDGTLTARGAVWLPEARALGTVDATAATELVAPHVEAIAGDVRGGGPLERLELDEVVVIGGDLSLVDAPGLARVDVTLLDDVGTIEVRGAPNLADLAPRRLRTVRGDLVLADAGLTDLEGFDSLRTVAGDLHLTGLAEPDALSGFPLLTEVGGALEVTGLPALAAIDGLDALEVVGGDLTVGGTPAMVSILGLNAVERVGGDVRITGPTRLTAVRGLSALVSARTVEVVDHATLRDLPGLGALEQAGIVLTDLPELEAVPAPRLGDGGELALTRVAITGLDGWNQLTVAEALVLDGNPFLASLDGVELLDTVTGDVRIVDNPRLPADLAWDLVDRLSIGGTVTVDGNGDLAE